MLRDAVKIALPSADGEYAAACEFPVLEFLKKRALVGKIAPANRLVPNACKVEMTILKKRHAERIVGEGIARLGLERFSHRFELLSLSWR
jgi:hypothetical protein